MSRSATCCVCSQVVDHPNNSPSSAVVCSKCFTIDTSGDDYIIAGIYVGEHDDATEVSATQVAQFVAFLSKPRASTAEIGRYVVGDHVAFLRRRSEGATWSAGVVTRVESWRRRDSTVGHRIEVSERMDASDELRYGCWVFEDGDEDTLRLKSKVQE